MARTRHVPRVRPEHAANDTVAPSSTNSIPQLPEELLRLIISHLDTSSDFDLRHNEEKLYRNTLLSLCLANKVFLRLAREVLYRTIHMDFGRSIVVQFSRLVVESRAELGDLVKRLRVDYWDMDDFDPITRDQCREPLSDHSRMMYANAVEAPVVKPLVDMVVRTGGDFLEDLMAGKQDAHLAFLILRCEKLEVLSLLLPHGFSKQFNWTSRVLMRAAASSERRLGCLKELRVQHWDTKGCVDIDDVWDLLQLDSLKIFHGRQLDLSPGYTPGDNGGTVEAGWPPHRYLKLQEVYLELSIVDAHGLSNFLSCCADLKVLSIHWGNVLQGDAIIWWDQLGDVLRKCPITAKLKSVTFDIFDSMYYDSEEGCSTSNHPALGDLTALASLESLDIPAPALWGLDENGLVNANLPAIVHTLPPTLQRLGISCWNECPGMGDRVFDEQEESAMGMAEVLTADDRVLKNLEVLTVSEGTIRTQDWTVTMKREANGDLNTNRRTPIDET